MLIVTKGLHCIIGDCHPADGKTAHKNLMEKAGVRLEDVLYAGAVARLRSGSINTRHHGVRDLTNFSDPLLANNPKKRKELEEAVREIKRKVAAGHFVWYHDFALYRREQDPVQHLLLRFNRNRVKKETDSRVERLSGRTTEPTGSVITFAECAVRKQTFHETK